MPTGSSGSVKVFYPSYRREELIALLQQRLPALRAALPVEQVVLFGSWAVGRATAFSDIDLLVVYRGPPRRDAYALVRRSLGVRGLEPHVYCEEEARAMAATLARMTRSGVRLR